MNQKRKKGFTLIELLAVIVILAIIALIAVPVIMNIINQANKSAFKDTAYGVIQAGELYFAEKQLEPNGMSGDVTLDLPDTTKQLVLKGEVPKGTITITEDGDISIAVTNGRYCATKGLEERDVTITEDVENCTPGGSNPGDISELALGDPVYFNPVENRLCDKNTEYVPGNSATGFKDGCMKWYVYKMDGDNVGLILDHNTTATVAWYSDGDDTTYNETNEQGPITLMNQLKADTEDQGWKVEADVISIDNVLNLMPFYQELDETGKTNWMDTFGTLISSALEDTNTNVVESDYSTTLEYYKAQVAYLKENYSEIMLPEYMYSDLMDNNCSDDGSCTTYGYWTSSAVAGNPSDAWRVGLDGFPYSHDVSFDGFVGLRPVITLSK